MFYVFVKQIYAQRVLIFSFPSVGWSVGRPVFAKPINLNCVLWIFSIFQSHGIRFSKKLKEKLRPKTQTQAATRPTSEKWKWLISHDETVKGQYITHLEALAAWITICLTNPAHCSSLLHTNTHRNTQSRTHSPTHRRNQLFPKPFEKAQ